MDLNTLIAQSRPADEAFGDMAARDPEMAEVIAEYDRRVAAEDDACAKVKAVSEVVNANAWLLEDWTDLAAKNRARTLVSEAAEGDPMVALDGMDRLIAEIGRVADRLSGTRAYGPRHARVTRTAECGTRANRAGGELLDVVADMVLARNGHAPVGR